MHIHHLIRGGLLLLGTGIAAMTLTASTSVASPGATAAPAALHRAVRPDVEALHALPLAPAATPVRIEVATEAPAAEEPEPVPEPAPDHPVVQAGPGPAVPVDGAITLIDPLVIER